MSPAHEQEDTFRAGCLASTQAPQHVVGLQLLAGPRLEDLHDLLTADDQHDAVTRGRFQECFQARQQSLPRFLEYRLPESACNVELGVDLPSQALAIDAHQLPERLLPLLLSEQCTRRGTHHRHRVQFLLDAAVDVQSIAASEERGCHLTRPSAVPAHAFEEHVQQYMPTVTATSILQTPAAHPEGIALEYNEVRRRPLWVHNCSFVHPFKDIRH
mmetsp:Transcript_55183/g.118581  ORF Transcript_55183/g.118581 Transcript_55183/m.118581 type:complete len:215 (-) Transcript_55183:2033-2677(-)